MPEDERELASTNEMLDELAAQLDDRSPDTPVFFIYEKVTGEEFPLVVIDVSLITDDGDKVVVRLAE
jgi:hypothetical protein